jgi:MFS family permease
VLPTYAQIGIFAPVLLVTLRIIQGLGAGAEISGAGTMLAEYAPKGKRGIISSLVAMGTNCGTLSATAIWAVMFFALDREELLAWGWRIPFLASVVVMIFAIWLRMNLKESPVFEKVNAEEAPPLQGFGISSPDQVKAAIDANAAGAISGSAIVKIIEKNVDRPEQMLSELKTFVSAMKAATRA